MPSSKSRNRRGAQAAKSGGLAGFSNLSLPHAVAEFRGRLIAQHSSLSAPQRAERIAKASAFAFRLGAGGSLVSASAAGASTPSVVDSDGLYWGVVTSRHADDDAAGDDVGSDGLSPGETLAFNALLSYAGEERGGAFYRHLKARVRRRDREAEMFKEAFRYSNIAVAATGPDRRLTAAEAMAAGKGLGLMGRMMQAAAAVAAKAKADADAVAAAAEAAVDRKALVKARWLIVFKRMRIEYLNGLRDYDSHYAGILDDAYDQLDNEIEHFRTTWPSAFDLTHDSAAKGLVFLDDWANLMEAQVSYQHALDEDNAHWYRVKGVSAIINWWSKVSRASKKPKRRAPRPNAAARAAEQAAAIKSLPNYLKPTEASAYTKPVEEIASLRFGNLPLANGAKQCGQLRNAIRAFVEDQRGRLAPTTAGDGAIFTPLRNAQTVGYCFVKFANAAEATRFLQIVSDPAKCLLIDPVTNVKWELNIERAASERKSKAQMEAEKLTKQKEKTSETQRIVDMMRADARGTAKQVVALAPVCLGAAAAAAKKDAVAKAAEALKAKIAAMFPDNLGTAPATAVKTFTTSFAAMAAKAPPPPAAKQIIVDPFTTIIDGERWGMYFNPLTELGKAQASLRATMNEEEEKEKAKEQRARRLERRKRNLRSKICQGASDRFGMEVDTDDEE